MLLVCMIFYFCLFPNESVHICSVGGLYFWSFQFSKAMCAELNIIILLHPCFAVLCNIVLHAFAHQNEVT